MKYFVEYFNTTPEIICRVRKELGLDERRVKEAVDGIKKWLELQPHLPKEEDDDRLERWLIRCKNNMEKTKRSLDSYYTLRTLTPDLMTGWDINEPWFEESLKYGYMMAMRERTPDADRVVIMGFNAMDSKDLNITHLLKAVLIPFEIRMTEDYYNKDIFIFDLKNLTPSHATKFTPPIIKKFMVCFLNGYNLRFRALHVVNTPAYAEAVIAVLRVLLKKKLQERVHVHGTDLTSLHKHVPKQCLPSELGGECGSTEEICDMNLKLFKNYREWYLKLEKMKSDESKRPEGGKNSNDLFGFDGSFRTLSID